MPTPVRRRKDSRFALCGLNCALCPRYHAEGSSRCPGCGGEGFEAKHPTCPVFTCNKKHGDVEHCFQCGAYPCARYQKCGGKDSFISYRRVVENLAKAQRDTAAYLAELSRREELLRELLSFYNDGKHKTIFCIAANDLPLETLESAMAEMAGDESLKATDVRGRAAKASALLKERAVESGLELGLRK